MQRLLTILIPVLLTVMSPSYVLAADYAPLTEEQLNSYYTEIYKALSKAEERVQALQTAVNDNSRAPAWNDKLELQHAIIQLEVKRTLFANFKGTESLRSALVRDKLLQVLNNPGITESDLADLQTLVLEEKAKIKALGAPQTTVPSGT
jgi:hypothetical protein